ncbi:ArgK/MeaB family GTPase [Candidatus Odyssella thessalonicensis]|uniref:ArgK/MeaB family GTPase n=1 Tax=Candidatus Odyssella thessalonicensis TaxID=84647 RepID=UPI000225B4E6|nr:membrane ATPase/protein kinase [Candidatus Odyssella thessalonicensis]
MNTVEKWDLSNRRTLAKAISLIESTAEKDQPAADALITELGKMPSQAPAPVIAITGAPGAGKSTFIDAFGQKLANLGHLIAILTIDPTSPLSGGAILGDKTRMSKLAQHPNVFIRPSPSGAGRLGGVSAKTEDVIYILQAAGFEYIFIETVGVGQSEIDASLMSNIVMMLIAPGAGDELQGIKKGNLEFVDLLIVNKYDGDTKEIARATADDYQLALTGLNKKVILTSALEATNFEEILAAVNGCPRGPVSHDQALTLLKRRLESELLQKLMAIPAIAHFYHEVESQCLPTRIKAKIFNEKLKNLLTPQ